MKVTISERVTEVAAGLDALAVPLSLARLERLGLEGSGAYAYYQVRLHRGTIFAPYELALAGALAGWDRAPRIAHEIGGGFGGLSLLLARLGFRTVCLEYDVKRYHGAMALWEVLSTSFPDLKNNCKMINARFPMTLAELPAVGAMAVITNLVCTTTPEAKAEMLAALSAYTAAIIDIDRFLVQLRSPEERQLRLLEFQAAGLVDEPFLDLGAEACFYRLTSDHTAGSSYG